MIIITIMMTTTRTAACLASAIATTIADHWHPPATITGYDNTWTDGTD